MTTTSTRYTIVLPANDDRGPVVYYTGVGPSGPRWSGSNEHAQSVGGRREAFQCVKALRRYYQLPALRIAPLT